jgi:hypothetical protein
LTARAVIERLRGEAPASEAISSEPEEEIFGEGVAVISMEVVPPIEGAYTESTAVLVSQSSLESPPIVSVSVPKATSCAAIVPAIPPLAGSPFCAIMVQ